jgi:hypothetical protein
MKPKEKAHQLVDRYYQTTPMEQWFKVPKKYLKSGIIIEYKSWQHAKECAIIAVNEIISQSSNKVVHLDRNGLTDYDYWWQVKKEIENL